VIVVAEGAGWDLMEKTAERDTSGNVRYGDIGTFLRDVIKVYFKKAGIELTIKYIDPSYTIRSVPTNPHDSVFCLLLGHSAVHAGMSGRTIMVVGFWNHQFTHDTYPSPQRSAKRSTLSQRCGAPFPPPPDKRRKYFY
jgi:6-phosphofructokinase 1